MLQGNSGSGAADNTTVQNDLDAELANPDQMLGL